MPVRLAFRLLFLIAPLLVVNEAKASEPPRSDIDNPFSGFDLPDDWEKRFWASANAQTLLKLEPKGIADLVPPQAGLRYCRCPACDAKEDDDPLAWSADAPKSLKCKSCSAVFPDPKAPAPPPDKKPPEETIEVLPRLVHHYPYVEVADLQQRYPGERLYLEAKADYEAREFLSKAALYSAVRYQEQPADKKDPALADLAALIILKFAQVYPAYATHFDQPSSPKFLQQADLAPPYRRGYKTAKWDWSGSLEVPLNLVIAYALIRDDPAIAKAAEFLKVDDSKHLVEQVFFKAAAHFTQAQPEEVSEDSLEATRGILAVGRVLDDPLLVKDAIVKLERFSRRGFYYDGFWNEGTFHSHQRVLSQVDGWIDRLMLGFRSTRRPNERLSNDSTLPLLDLARAAGSASLTESNPDEVATVSWPALPLSASPRRPRLLGGIGIAELSVGEADNGLDLELRGLDSFGPERIQRQALRLGAGGRILLGDLDESQGLPDGFDRASVSRNTVVVDGLNQRESLIASREPAPGGNFLFFAADSDFQVATLDDPRSYPKSTKRYRQTVIATSGPSNRYALSVFEVQGGLQHDQFFHGPAGVSTRWELAVPTTPGPSTLLPPSLTFVPNAMPDDGRWFVQAQGNFVDLAGTKIDKPTVATLVDRTENKPILRQHLLTNGSVNLITASGPDSNSKAPRGSLLIRRRSAEGSNLDTVFVTVFEPLKAAIPKLRRVGRVASNETSVVVYVESADGPEEVVVNLAPGKVCQGVLADGRAFSTDGIAARFRGTEIVLAGGTFAESNGVRVEQGHAKGTILAAIRRLEGESRGLFETDAKIVDPERLIHRTLLVRHGDGTTRGWTIQSVQNTDNGARIFVREEPGFVIDPKSQFAAYYQFPQSKFPGPHTFGISSVAR